MSQSVMGPSKGNRDICPRQIFIPDLLKALVHTWSYSIVDKAAPFARAAAVCQEDHWF